MTKTLTFFSILFILSGCISKKKYAELQAENERLQISAPIEQAAEEQEKVLVDDLKMQLQQAEQRSKDMNRTIEKYQMMKEAGEIKEPSPEQMEAYRVKNDQAVAEAEQKRMEAETEEMLQRTYMDGEYVLKVIESSLEQATTGYSNKQIGMQKKAGSLYLSINAKELFEDDKAAISANGKSLLNKLSVVLNLKQPMNYSLVGVTEEKANLGQASNRALAVHQFFQTLEEPGHPANMIGMTTCSKSKGVNSAGCERIDLIFTHDYSVIMMEVDNSLKR